MDGHFVVFVLLRMALCAVGGACRHACDPLHRTRRAGQQRRALRAEVTRRVCVVWHLVWPFTLRRAALPELFHGICRRFRPAPAQGGTAGGRRAGQPVDQDNRLEGVGALQAHGAFRDGA